MADSLRPLCEDGVMSEQAASGAGSARTPTGQPTPALAERLAGLGREIGERERDHGESLRRAHDCAEALHRKVAGALEAFHAAAAASGAPHLRVALAAPRSDDKHLRSVQFDLRRGRTVAIVTVKSRGDVTLVGPFHAGKTEGPCKSFPQDAADEIDRALGEFLESFLQEAATP
jgi:hypothetical protein